MKDAESLASVVHNIDRLNLKSRSVAVNNTTKNQALHDVHRSLQRPALRCFNARSADLRQHPLQTDDPRLRHQILQTILEKPVRSAEDS